MILTKRVSLLMADRDAMKEKLSKIKARGKTYDPN